MSGSTGHKKIIILFDEYPYTPGEYSFIKTELELLAEHFEVSIISMSASAEQQMLVDDRITVYHCIRKFGIREKFFAIIKFIISKNTRHEIKQIFKSKSSYLGRLYDSVVYYECAEQLRKFVKNNCIIGENMLIYSYWFNANCLAFLLGKRVYPGLKVVSRIHGYDLYNERNPHNRQPFREYMDSTVDKIFFVADMGKQYYIENWGSTEAVGEKYVVAPIGTVNKKNKEELLKRFQETEFLKIVSCSNVIALKRVALIVEGLSKIDDIKISWTHFGTGDLLTEIEEQAARLLADKSNISYDLKGFVPVEDIMKFYDDNYVDCFLTTSSTEGCPVSIQEAMSYGIPIIGTAVGEIPNMINGNGFLISETPTPEDVCDAIHCLYACTEEQICNMRRQSRRLWERKYNAIDNATNFVAELEKL